MNATLNIKEKLMSKYQLVGTCVETPAVEIDPFDDSARDITIKHAMRCIGKKYLAEIFPSYAWTKEQVKKGWVVFEKDWSIYAQVGKFRGKRCVCIFWSGIHHFFVMD
jgi:hypothetical protein